MTGPPTTVYIAPYEYALHFDPSKLDQESVRAKKPLWGYATPGTQIIGVDPTASEATKRTVVIHELIHSILDASGYGHPKKVKDLEQFLNVLSAGLLGLLRTNHQLVAWLADMTVSDDPVGLPQDPEDAEDAEDRTDHLSELVSR